VSYGQFLNNAFYLKEFGFVPAVNPFNTLSVLLTFAEEDVHLQAKIDASPGKTPLCSFMLTQDLGNQSSKNFLSFMRFKLWKGELNTLINVDLNTFDVPFQNVEHEKEVWMDVLNGTKDLYHKYLQSYQDDEAMIQASDYSERSENEQNILQLVYREKAILMYFMLAADNMIKLFNESFKDATKTIKTCEESKYNNMFGYVNEVVLPALENKVEQ
jgi:hypothetical protein